MHERGKLYIDLEVALVGFAWFGADDFQRALGDDLCLAHAQKNLPIFTSKSDLVHLPRRISSLALKLCLPD